MDGREIMSNWNVYDSSGVVRFYARLNGLKEPEKRIYEMIGPDLKKTRMLDIGVGGGRTTFYFAPQVASYAGIDYSVHMIEACRERFGHSSHIAFHVCDARSMDMLEDDSFDFILFSFNGIDYISSEDRMRVFNEVRRVGVGKALFAFSTHNLQHIRTLYRPRVQYNPRNMLKEIIRIFVIRAQYRTWRDAMKYDCTAINDGLHFFRLKSFYIRPGYQVAQLEENGFSDVKVLEPRTGREISHDLEPWDDEYLYYLCTVEK